MSEQTILSNLSKPRTDSKFIGNNGSFGIGSQIRLFTQVTIQHVVLKLMKADSPTGSLVAQLYSSNGDFGSIDAYADTLIAQSTNAVNLSNLPTSFGNVDFYFNNIAVTGGVYFIVIFSSDMNCDNGHIQLAETDAPGSQFGYMTFWDPNGIRWQPWSWD
jgi:hypothetical protein